MPTVTNNNYPASWRSEHIEEQLSDARPVIFNSVPLFALMPSDESGVHMKLPTISGVSGGIVVPDSPLANPNKLFLAAASAGDGRSMVTQYARVRKLALDDPLRWFFKFEVDREVEEGLDVTLPGNATPTRVRLFLYAQSNAGDPQLRAELSKLYRNPNFHFQFSLALYYEAMEAQARLLVAGAQRIREVTTDTAATRARVSGLLDAPRAQAVSMGVVSAGVSLMRKSPQTRQQPKKGGTDNQQRQSATFDPRLSSIDPPTPSTTATNSARTKADGLASVPMARGAGIGFSGSSQATKTPPSSPAGVGSGEPLTRNQRRRRNKANRELASLASATTTSLSSPSNTPSTSYSLPTLAAKEQRQVKFDTPQTPPTTPAAPRTPNTLSAPYPSTRSAPASRLPPQNRFSPLERHIANSHKRQHSSPSSSSSGSAGRQRINYVRQNPTYRQNHDWRTQSGSGKQSSTGNSPSTPSPVTTYGVGNSLGSPQTLTTHYSSVPYPNIPPPFSWDHIVHTRSRAVVHNPSSHNHDSNAGTASVSPQVSAPPPPYVPSSRPQKSYADIVFGRSGASITAPSGSSVSPTPAPAHRRRLGADSKALQLPQAPLRTGGNQIDLAKLPRASTFTPGSTRQLPVASSSSSSPSYVATFATIPRTVEANTLTDLQHGVDDCNTYPTLSDISEMPEEEHADDEGEFTEVVSKKARRSARLTAKVSSSISSPSPPISSTQALTSHPTPQPTIQHDHSYVGKGKQRAFNQGSGEFRSNFGKLPKLPKDLELELSTPRRQKKREFRRDEPYGVIRNMRAHISKLEGMIWESAKKEDGSLRTRADRWRVIGGH